MSDRFFIASTDTRHFRFEGVGLDESGARKALKVALQRHGRQWRLPKGWAAIYLTDDTVTIREVKVGGTYRDHEEIHS